jgi:hypothetical protein
MQNTVDTAWERTSGVGSAWELIGPSLDVCRWSFAYLPDARMKAVVAGWMVRVLLGADPAEMSDEELRIVAMSCVLAPREGEERGLGWDA